MNYLSEVKGKSGTVARVVAYSIAENSQTPLITFEYEAYRGILAELNTHNMLTKNAESSRAVPVWKRVDRIKDGDYYRPIKWGTNVGGMVAGEENNNHIKFSCGDYSRGALWDEWAKVNAEYAKAFDAAKYSKEVVGRPLEAFTTIKGVISGTEWGNFFHLRRAPDADPAIKELADCMWRAKCIVEEEKTYKFLNPGQWHLPYVQTVECMDTGHQYYFKGVPFDSDEITLEEAQKTSAVACGQVSFRKLDTSEETVERVWKRLMEGEAKHASVTAHQGTPMKVFQWPEYCCADVWLDCEEEGISHADRSKDYWSAQFKHWVMFRKLIPNESCTNYVPKEEETL